ncbi:MAG: serine hydrolase domain-containing protein [Burkholderiales bacterium]|nr:serine hydrolase domain-containing protein [Burkholderiales bacterium]
MRRVSTVVDLSRLVLLGALVAHCGLIRPALANGEDLSPMLANIRTVQKIPGAAAVVMKDGRVVAEGATGVRRLGEDAAIVSDNRFAVGSVTKRMTAYLVARLVEDGKLSTELKLGDVLKDIPMRDEYKGVTLGQLLAFTGGIAGYERIGPRITPELFDTNGTVSEREAKFAQHVLNQPPAGAIGKEAVYSNASYMLAAIMVSRVMGKPYMDLMAEQVFRPLEMTRAGWGRPWSAERKDEPWLHVARPDGYAPEPDIERPPEVLFRAAGNAHMSVADMARFAHEDMQARRGKGKFLKSAGLWTRIGSEREVDPAARSVHAGGTPWLAACYAVWPLQGLVAAIAVNGGTPGDATCKAFVKEVENRFVPVKTARL